MAGLRRASLIAGMASIVLPAAYAFAQLRAFDARVATQGGVACGLPVIGIAALAMLASMLLSLVAIGLGVAAYRRQPGPRTAHRTVEVFLLALPSVVAAAVATYFVLRY
jgi:hypothetical protein